MLQRVALFVGSVAAAFILAIALAATGFAPGASPASPDSAALNAPDPSTPDEPSPTPRIQVDTVYVAPRPTPATLTIHQTAPSASGAEQENEVEHGSEGD